jgi:hypothetical protein
MKVEVGSEDAGAEGLEAGIVDASARNPSELDARPHGIARIATETSVPLQSNRRITLRRALGGKVTKRLAAFGRSIPP